MAVLISLGSGRTVVPNTAPWNATEELQTFALELGKKDDSTVQNEGSGMLVLPTKKEESAPILETSSLNRSNESTNELVANTVDAKALPRPTHRRIKRNPHKCIMAKAKHFENGVTYTVVKCHSKCYPIFGKTKLGKPIVAGCVKKPASG